MKSVDIRCLYNLKSAKIVNPLFLGILILNECSSLMSTELFFRRYSFVFFCFVTNFLSPDFLS